MAITKASKVSHLWRRPGRHWLFYPGLCRFITKSEVEGCQWADAARVMCYGEFKKLRKRLKAWVLDVPKSISSTSTSFGFITMKNQNLTYLVHRGQS